MACEEWPKFGYRLTESFNKLSVRDSLWWILLSILSLIGMQFNEDFSPIIVWLTFSVRMEFVLKAKYSAEVKEERRRAAFFNQSGVIHI